jgi:YhcN/YlaJ family sporulation lipoprotein
MFISQSPKKVLILIVVTLSILMSGCMNRYNVKQQGSPTPIQQQQVQQPRNVDNRIQIANKAAAKITSLPGVMQANVLVTQRNAYVAAVLKNNAQLTQDIEKQIADQVRSTDPNIQNVYVSTNPDLVDRFNTYVRDVQQGRPVSGFVDQFNEIVRRIFPNAK